MPLRQSGLVVLSVYNIFGNVRGALVEQRQWGTTDSSHMDKVCLTHVLETPLHPV